MTLLRKKIEDNTYNNLTVFAHWLNSARISQRFISLLILIQQRIAFQYSVIKDKTNSILYISHCFFTTCKQVYSEVPKKGKVYLWCSNSGMEIYGATESSGNINQ